MFPTPHLGGIVSASSLDITGRLICAQKNLNNVSAELKARMLNRARPLLVPDPPPVTKSAEHQPKVSVPVATPASEILDPHRLVVATRKGLRRESPQSNGFIYLANSQRLDVWVSRACIARALCIMDGP